MVSTGSVTLSVKPQPSTLGCGGLPEESVQSGMGLGGFRCFPAEAWAARSAGVGTGSSPFVTLKTVASLFSGETPTQSGHMSYDRFRPITQPR